MAMKALQLLIYFLFLATGCWAQYNDSMHYYANFAGTGNLNQTNTTSSYLLNNAAKFGIKKKVYSLNLAGSWVYGETNKLLTNNDLMSSLAFDVYGRDTNFYYWGLANYNSSYSLKIKNQYQAGVGAGYNILSKKNIFLNLSDGILYDNSDLYLADSMHDIYSTVYNSLRVQFRITVHSIFTFTETTFIQNSFIDISDYIIISNAAVTVKLNKWLNLTTNFAYNRINRTQSENKLFTYGLTFDKYF